jgi:DNA-binding IclR family transcriptional regulator
LEVLRHEDDMRPLHCGAASLCKLAQADLPAMEKVCREQLDVEEGRGRSD